MLRYDTGVPSSSLISSAFRRSSSNICRRTQACLTSATPILPWSSAQTRRSHGAGEKTMDLTHPNNAVREDLKLHIVEDSPGSSLLSRCCTSKTEIDPPCDEGAHKC